MQAISQLKKELWKHFSLYVKLKHSENGWASCFTCGGSIQGSDCHAGHYLSKGSFPVHYFNEDNVRPQCWDCNINLQGNVEVFRERLIEEVGKEKVDDLYDKRHFNSKRNKGWYQKRIEYYKNLNKEIL